MTPSRDEQQAVPAVRQRVSGADRVARLLAGFAAQSSDAVVSSMSMNVRGLHIELNGKLDTAIGLTVEDGRITGIYAIRTRTTSPRWARPCH